MQVEVGEDLAVGIGTASARLTPGEAFRLAENLIRRATVAMIVEETDRAAGLETHRAIRARTDQ